jgi:hypothetical protein
VKLEFPYYTEKSTVAVLNESVEVKAFQIIVWVTILHDAREFDSSATKFPAILDTGTTHNFVITKDHLSRWAGLQASDLPKVGRVRLEGKHDARSSVPVFVYTPVEIASNLRLKKASPFSTELGRDSRFSDSALLPTVSCKR